MPWSLGRSPHRPSPSAGPGYFPLASFPLLRTPRPALPPSASCPQGFISASRSFQSLTGPAGFLCVRWRPGALPTHRSAPGPRVLEAKQRFLVPQRAPLIRPQFLGRALTPRFPGPPASTPVIEDRTQPGSRRPRGRSGDRGAAVREGLTPRTRGAPGWPRWSQARRWRIFGAHCAA